jgi:SAM-dependent methyltransferase
VLQQRYDADYHECADCHALQVIAPPWADETDRLQAAPGSPGAGAALARAGSVYCSLRAAQHVGLLPEQPRGLDFSGNGTLAQLLEDAGFDTWHCAPDPRQPFLAPDRFLADLAAVPDNAFDVVTPFDVLEHQSDPHRIGRELCRLLRPDGLLVLSGQLYQPDCHGPDWRYLAGGAGQHVTFWSGRALAHYAAVLGFVSIAHFQGRQNTCTLFSAVPAAELQARLARSGELLRSPGFLERLTGRRLGHFSVPAVCQVAPAIPLHGGLTCAS